MIPTPEPLLNPHHSGPQIASTVENVGRSHLPDSISIFHPSVSFVVDSRRLLTWPLLSEMKQQIHEIFLQARTYLTILPQVSGVFRNLNQQPLREIFYQICRVPV